MDYYYLFSLIYGNFYYLFFRYAIKYVGLEYVGIGYASGFKGIPGGPCTTACIGLVAVSRFLKKSYTNVFYGNLNSAVKLIPTYAALYLG